MTAQITYDTQQTISYYSLGTPILSWISGSTNKQEQDQIEVLLFGFTLAVAKYSK